MWCTLPLLEIRSVCVFVKHKPSLKDWEVKALKNNTESYFGAGGKSYNWQGFSFSEEL